MTEFERMENLCRIRIYTLCEFDIVSMLNGFVPAGGGKLPHAIVVPRLSGVPEGAVIVAVKGNFAARSVDVCVQHESFDIIPAGVFAPRMSGSLQAFGVLLAPPNAQTKKFLEDEAARFNTFWCKKPLSPGEK